MKQEKETEDVHPDKACIMQESALLNSQGPSAQELQALVPKTGLESTTITKIIEKEQRNAFKAAQS